MRLNIEINELILFKIPAFIISVLRKVVYLTNSFIYQHKSFFSG